MNDVILIVWAPPSGPGFSLQVLTTLSVAAGFSLQSLAQDSGNISGKTKLATCLKLIQLTHQITSTALCRNISRPLPGGKKYLPGKGVE